MRHSLYCRGGFPSELTRGAVTGMMSDLAGRSLCVYVRAVNVLTHRDRKSLGCRGITVATPTYNPAANNLCIC